MNSLERPWKRAQIHEETMRLFRSEAEKEKPDFRGIAEGLFEKHKNNLAPKQLPAVRRQLQKLEWAASTAQKIREHYKGRPEELCLALYGVKPENIKLERAPFHVALVLPQRDWVKFHRLLIDDELPGLPSALKTVLASFKAWDTGGVMGLLSEINPNLSAEAVAARREIEDRTGQPFDSVSTLFTLNTGRKGVGHEEKHVVSFLLSAGTKRMKPPYEELRANWTPWPWWKPGTAAGLLDKVEQQGFAATEKARVAGALLKKLRGVRTCYGKRDQAAFKGHLDEIALLAKKWKILLPKKLPDKAEPLCKQLENALESAEAREDAETLQGLGEINRLQKRHGLTDDLIFSLLGTNNAKTVAEIIRHNVAKQKKA